MVEKWLLQVEETMVLSIRDVIRKSVNAYAVTPRKQWVIEWPGQIAICVSCIYWTGEVTDAMGMSRGMQVSSTDVYYYYRLLRRRSSTILQLNTHNTIHNIIT